VAIQYSGAGIGRFMPPSIGDVGNFRTARKMTPSRFAFCPIWHSSLTKTRLRLLSQDAEYTISNTHIENGRAHWTSQLGT
jgi:hypothetical protein